MNGQTAKSDVPPVRGVKQVFQWTGDHFQVRRSFLVLFIVLMAGSARAQDPRMISLRNAVELARLYGTSIQGARLTASAAREARVQARAAALPAANLLNQTIQTQGNGSASGVFVANNGVHLYDEQIVVHQDLLALARHGEVNRAAAAEALAKARIDVAARGMDATTVQNYYSVVAAARRMANLQVSLNEAARFVELTQKQEAGGEVARADVVKARITLQQRQRDQQDAQLALAKARISLGVLIFPDLREDFVVEDDAKSSLPLSGQGQITTQAAAASPELKAAEAGILEAGYDAKVARYAWLPALNFDVLYGLDSNQFAFHTPEDQRNLGYAAQFSLNVPLWNWGATRSKIKQADLRKQQADLELTAAQRSLKAGVATAYREAELAQAQLESLRSSVELATESLRLTTLRYQAGESSALEVVDAQTTLSQSRNAADDGEVRARQSAISLQLLTGTF